MEKRTKLWRRKQGFRVFKARMIYYASFEREYLTALIPQHYNIKHILIS